MILILVSATPLIGAAAGGFDDVVKLLVAANAAVNKAKASSYSLSKGQQYAHLKQEAEVKHVRQQIYDRKYIASGRKKESAEPSNVWMRSVTRGMSQDSGWSKLLAL